MYNLRSQESKTGILAKEEFAMSRHARWFVLLLNVVACTAFGEMDPKGFLASKSVDFTKAHALPFESPDQTMFENVIIDGQRYAMVAAWKKNKLEPIGLYPLATVQIPFVAPDAIVIDGDDADWIAAGIQPLIVDPAGDDDYLTTPGTDLASLHLARGGGNMHFLMTLHDGNPRQDTMYVVEFQQYITQLHTPGDVVVMALYQGGAWTVTISARGPGMDWYFTGSAVAAGTNKLEWKVPINKIEYPPDTPLPFFPPFPPRPQGINDRYIRAYIHPALGGTSPVADENEWDTRPLVVNFR